METLSRRCPVCNTVKLETEFYGRSDRPGKAQSHCKECNNKGVVERVRANKAKAADLLGGKCSKCSYDRCLAALDFHHRDPSQKEVSPNRLFYRSWKKILEEIEKCDLLCANCHRELHSVL